MELTPKIVDQWKQIITAILHDFVTVCEQNGFRYFAFYGTCLGAVRHQGIIPWDDDIDVCMPRNDYERFIDYIKTNPIDGVELHIPSKESLYYCLFAKLCKKEATLYEFRKARYVLGPFIDIFPLDGCPESFSEVQKYQQKYQELINLYTESVYNHSFTYYLSLIKKGHLWTCMSLLFSRFAPAHFKSCLLSRMNRMINKYNFDTSNRVVSLCGFYGVKDIYERKWFDEYEECSFEDFRIRIPIGYSSYLSHLYGNYMKYPPMEKRTSNHTIEYLDMNKKYNYYEVVALLNKNSKK